jgi:hypothetical protein
MIIVYKLFKSIIRVNKLKNTFKSVFRTTAEKKHPPAINLIALVEETQAHKKVEKTRGLTHELKQKVEKSFVQAVIDDRSDQYGELRNDRGRS